MSKVIKLPVKLKPVRVETAESNTTTMTSEASLEILSSEFSTDVERAAALRSLLTLDPEQVHWQELNLSSIPGYLMSRNPEIPELAKQVIVRCAEHIAPHHKEFIPQWKSKITEVLRMDTRTTRFVQLYPRAVDYCICLAAVGKWLIQNDTHDLARFFLHLELESKIITGRKELSEIGTEFLDFCGYTYFLDYYPQAIDYMVQLLEGECLPQWEKPSPKTFSRLCCFKQHDKISQLMLSAVVKGDLGRVDWFTRNLLPHHFLNYLEYEKSLLEIIASEAMPKEVRENALSAILFVGDEQLTHRSYFNELVVLARAVFSRSELEILCIPETHPKTSQMLLQRLLMVR